MIFDDAKEKNKHAVATPEDQNNLHSLKIPRLPLSTRRVLTLSNANHQKSLDQEQFCFVFPRKVDSLLGLGNWWSWQFPLQSATHQSNLNTNLHPNGFFVLPRDADVATAGISAANCEKKYIRSAASTNNFFFLPKKSPKKCTPTGDRELVSKPLATYIITLLRTCINCNEFRLIRKREQRKTNIPKQQQKEELHSLHLLQLVKLFLTEKLKHTSRD